MNRKKQECYLSELFLDQLKGNCSLKAVLQALEMCNKEMLKRLGNYEYAEEWIDCFFKKEGEKQELSKKIKQEFSDFWDVYQGFDDIVSPKIKSGLLLLQML